MGTVANEAFLALEETVARRLSRAVDQAIADSVAEADRLIDQGKFDQAHAIVDEMASLAALTALEGAIRAKMVQGLLFGASQILEPSEAADGVADMEVAERAVSQMISLVNDGVQSDLKRAGHAFIQEVQRTALAEAEKRIEKGEFAGKFISLMNGKESALTSLSANLTTSRVISYGFLAQARAQGLRAYQVSEILDSKTCPVCRRMHGRQFKVAQAFSKVDALLRILDPQELKQAAPFPKQNKEALAELDKLSSKELQARGFDTPPYHPHCRGILVTKGTVKKPRVRPVTPRLPPPAPRPVDVIPTPPPAPTLPPNIIDDPVFGFVGKAEARVHAATFTRAEPRIAQAVKQARPTDVSWGKEPSGAWFEPGRNRIVVGNKSLQHSSPLNWQTTWRHEFGHKVDWDAGDLAFASRKVMQKGTFDADLAIIRKPLTGTERLTAPARVQLAKTRRARVRELIAEGRDADEGFDDFFKSFLDDEGKAAYDEYLELTSQHSTSIDQRAHFVVGWQDQNIDAIIHSLPDIGHSHALQDFFGAVTRNEFRYAWGHTDDYYAKFNKVRQGSKVFGSDGHGTEAFANYFAIFGDDIKVYKRVMKKFAPNTVKEFDKIVDAFNQKSVNVPTVNVHFDGDFQ